MEKFTQRDQDGALFTASLQIVLYANQPVAQLAQGATAAHEVFVERFGEELQWHLAGSMRRAQRFSKKSRKVFSTLCRTATVGLPPYRVWRGSGLHDFVPPAFATGAYASHSWLQVHLEPSLANDWKGLLRILTALARPFPFRSGTVGLSLCWNEMSVDRDNEVPRLIGPLLKRYPGFNVGTARQICDQGLPPVNWLTLLGPELVRSRGGPAAVRRAFEDDEEISILPLGRGVIIRAGEVPQLGDRTRKNDLPLYRKVGAFVKDLRGDQQIELDGLTLRESKRWLARFDT